MQVTLQIPILVHDGNVRVFRRKAEMQTTPRATIFLPTPVGPQILSAGTLLTGAGLPDVLTGKRYAKTMVMEVSENLDTGEIVAFLQGKREPTYTAEEYLEVLGPEWVLDPRPIAADDVLLCGPEAAPPDEPSED